MILSGPAFAFGIVKSLKIFAAFLASDFRLLGIGVLTILSSHKWILFYKNLKTRSRSNSYRPQMKFGARQFFTRVSFCSRGVSVQGSLCPVGGLCPGGLSTGVSVQGVSLSRGSLFPRGVSVQGWSLSRRPPAESPYGKERTVRILMECILVRFRSTVKFVKMFKNVTFCPPNTLSMI